MSRLCLLRTQIFFNKKKKKKRKKEGEHSSGIDFRGVLPVPVSDTYRTQVLGQNLRVREHSLDVYDTGKLV